MGGLSLWHWLIVLVIVVLVFGTKRLKNVGQDLGEAVKGFKKGMQDDDAQQQRLAAALSEATRKQVEVKVVVDATVLGGLVTRIGDTVIDGSVRHRLEQLKGTI